MDGLECRLVLGIGNGDVGFWGRGCWVAFRGGVGSLER